MPGFVKEFRDFVMRGNVVDLAIAVVLGVAFGAVVTSFVENLLTPLIAAIFGKQDFSSLVFTINDSTFRYGAFINAVISFLMIAIVIYFLVVKPLNARRARAERGEENVEEISDDERRHREVLAALDRIGTKS